MRSLTVTIAVAIGMGAAALGAGWTVQAAALPSPARGDLAAVDALVVLARHRYVVSAMHIGSGPVIDGACLQGWFPRRGTLLRLSDGASVFDHNHVHLDRRAVAELELAGCPRVLVAKVASLLQNGVRAHTARAGDELAVRIPDRPETLTLYVEPKGDVPVGVSLRGPHTTGSSRIRLVPLKPALARSAELRP